MAGGTKIGTMFAEINLDSSKYDAGLLKALENSKDTTTNVEKAWRTMGTRSAEAVDKMKANVINSYEAVKNSATSTAADIERAETQAKAKLTQINERYYRAQISHVRELEEETRRSNEAVSAGFTKAGKAVLAFGTAVAAASLVVAKSVVEQGMAFETTMKTVQAISSGSAKSVEELADNLERLTDAARKSGANTEWSAQQAGDALKYMAMTGMSVSDQIAGLPGLLDLATAAQMDLALAADIVTDSLTAFGMATSEIGRFNDALINTTIRANTNVEMLGESLKYVAPVAANMGYSIEKTAGLLGVLANSGIKAEQAGTSLRQSLIRTGGAAKSLGMDVNSSLIDVLEEMHKRQFSVNEVVEEFGLIASTGAVILMNNIDQYRDLTYQIENNEGATQSLATMIRDTLKVDFDLLKSSVSDVALELYELYGEKLKNMVSGMSRFVRENKDEFIAIGQAIGGIIELAIKSAGVIAKLTKEATFGRETPTYDSNAAFDVTIPKESPTAAYDKMVSEIRAAETALADYSEKLAKTKVKLDEALSDTSSSEQLISAYETQVRILEKKITETNNTITGIEVELGFNPDDIEKFTSEYLNKIMPSATFNVTAGAETDLATKKVTELKLEAAEAAKKMEALSEAWKKGIRTEEYYDSQVKALKDAKEAMIKNTGDELVAHAVYLVDRAKLDAEYYGTAKSSLKTHVSESQKIKDKFEDEYLRATLTSFEYQKSKLDEQLLDNINNNQDMLKATEMYNAKLKVLTDKKYADEEKATEKALEDFFKDIDAKAEAEQDAYDERAKAEQDFQDEQKELREDAYKDFSNTIQENTADILRDWDNAWETMTDIMKDALIEMAAEALTTNIIVPIAMEFGSAMGLSWNGVSFSDMTGTTGSSGFGTSLPSSTSINWVQSNVPGMGWLGSTVPGTANTSMIGAGASQGMVTPGSVTGTAASQGFGGMSYGTMAGYGAAGSLGYTYIGDAVGLPQGEYSGATAGVGAMGGAAMGASYGTYGGPIGAVIGAVIGGVLGSFMGPGEVDSDLTIKSIESRSGVASFDSSKLFDYQVDPDDIPSRDDDLIITEATIAYYDEYFTNLDDAMTSVDLKSILQNNSFKSTEDFEDFEGDFEGMLSEITDGIFEDLREPLVNALGLSVDTFDLSFFEGIQEVNGGSLMDVFADFESVFTTFSDFENRINEQMNDGLSLEQAYGNLQIISGMLDMASASIDSMASSSTITTLEEIVDVYDAYMQSMEDAMATQEEITQIQSALYQEIGSSVTGLTADSFQNAMIEASQSGGSVTESIKNMLNTSMAQAVAGAASESIFEAFLAPINEQIGAIVAGSIVDGVLTDSATMIESIGTIIDAVDWNGIEDAVSGAMDVLDGLSDVDITTTAAESNIGTTDLTPYGGWVSTVNAAGDGVTWAWAEDSRPESSNVESSDSIAEDQAQLNIELMYLQGEAAAALAMERQLELDAMDASLHATQKLIWALEDLADVEDFLIGLNDIIDGYSNSDIAQEYQDLIDWKQDQISTADDLSIDVSDLINSAYKAQIGGLVASVFDDFVTPVIEDFVKTMYTPFESALADIDSNAELAISSLDELSGLLADDAFFADDIKLLDGYKDKLTKVIEAIADVQRLQLASDMVSTLASAQAGVMGLGSEYELMRLGATYGVDLSSFENQKSTVDSLSMGSFEDFLSLSTELNIPMETLISDMQSLAGIVKETADTFDNLAETLSDYSSGLLLSDDSALSAELKTTLSRARFLDTYAASMSDDPEISQSAMAELPAAATSMLELSKSNSSSMYEYNKDMSLVLRSLEDAEKYAESNTNSSEDTLTEAEKHTEQLSHLSGMADDIILIDTAIREIWENADVQAFFADYDSLFGSGVFTSLDTAIGNLNVTLTDFTQLDWESIGRDATVDPTVFNPLTGSLDTLGTDIDTLGADIDTLGTDLVSLGTDIDTLSTAIGGIAGPDLNTPTPIVDDPYISYEGGNSESNIFDGGDHDPVNDPSLPMDLSTFTTTSGVTFEGSSLTPDDIVNFVTNSSRDVVWAAMKEYGITYDDIAEITNVTGPGFTFVGGDVENYLNTRGFADGGISTGPSSGHMELLHGTEAVIPLSNGFIPVEISSDDNEKIIEELRALRLDNKMLLKENNAYLKKLHTIMRTKQSEDGTAFVTEAA